jgi:glycosyltransferase involved in cell wall biosynthesis
VRVALDVTSLTGSRVSGIGNYIGHLTAALQARSEAEVHGTFPWSRAFRRGWVHRHFPAISTRLWWGGLSESNYDLYHGPDFGLPSLKKVRRVVTIHDLAFLEPGMASPDHAERSRRKIDHSLVASAPDAVITVSDFVRAGVLARYPQLRGKVITVYHGADHLAAGGHPAEEHRQTLEAENTPYFLFVGNLEARKNLPRLIRAFEELARVHADIRLVLVGATGYGAEEVIRLCSSSIFSKRIEWRGFVPKAALIDLYRRAVGFVYPSLHEGFGFPALEAMSLGVPVMTSRGSGLEEVAGAASAVQVDPLDIESIRLGLNTLLAGDSKQRSLWIEAGLARARELTWSQCARRTLMVYRFAVSADRP